MSSKPEEVRLHLDDNVNRLAFSAAKLLEQLRPDELLKVEREFGGGSMKVKSNAAGFKKLVMLVGFCYVQAIKEAREKRLADAKPLPNQQELFSERTHA